MTKDLSTRKDQERSDSCWKSLCYRRRFEPSRPIRAKDDRLKVRCSSRNIRIARKVRPMQSRGEQSTIEQLRQVFIENEDKLGWTIDAENHKLWTSNSEAFRQIDQILDRSDIGSNKSPVTKNSSDERLDRQELKLYTKEQFASAINRIYPFHLDFFTGKCSSLTVEQQRMGLYLFYDVNRGFIDKNLEKEMSKKTQRGKNMKRMNGLLLNEHRLFNAAAKQYAEEHLHRDYQVVKPSVERFLDNWLNHKSSVLKNRSIGVDRFYKVKMKIPKTAYDSVDPLSLIHLSTLLRLGSIARLTLPDQLENLTIKCTDDRDQVVSNRFNSKHRFTNLIDDVNILAILSENPSIDVVLSKSTFNELIEVFSSDSKSTSFPLSIREFLFDRLQTSNETSKKKIIFVDKPFRRSVYTKRQLNEKFFQRSFRSLLLSITGGKRDQTNKPFQFVSFTDKVEYSLSELRIPSLIEANREESEQTDQNSSRNEEEDEEEEDDDEQQTMIISTDENIEEQQKHFHKVKKRLIQSAPVLQSRTEPSASDDQNRSNEPIAMTRQLKLSTPVQGNYEYSLWQLGTIKVLLRCSHHGFISSNNGENDQSVTCYSKLEYQPQFGLEQLTEQEYRHLWLQSFIRQGSDIILGRINVFQQQILKIEQLTYKDIEENLKQLNIDLLKPMGKIYGLLYGLQSLEPKNYIVSCLSNEMNITLFESTGDQSGEQIIDVECQPIESNDLLIKSDVTVVPWIPLTPTILLPYHLEFERIPLTFRPRLKKCYDIEITIPSHRLRRNFDRDETLNKERKKRKKQKKKNNQRRRKEKVAAELPQ